MNSCSETQHCSSTRALITLPFILPPFICQRLDVLMALCKHSAQHTCAMTVPLKEFVSRMSAPASR